MWCNAPALVPGPWSPARPPAWPGKEEAMTSPAAELLQDARPELWWMSIRWVRLTLLGIRGEPFQPSIPVVINSAPRKCIPRTEIRAPCTMPGRGSFMYHQSFGFSTKDAGKAMTTTQRLFWAFAYSHLFEPQIICSFKALCLNCCIPEETRPLMIIVPSMSILNYNPVNTKTPKVPGCFEALTIFQNKQGLLLSTLPVTVPDSQLFPAACGLQLFLLSLNSRLGLRLHHMAHRAGGSKEKTG